MFERFYVKQYGKHVVHPLAESDKTECGLEVEPHHGVTIMAPLDPSLYGDLCIGCLDVVKTEGRAR